MVTHESGGVRSEGYVLPKSNLIIGKTPLNGGDAEENIRRAADDIKATLGLNLSPPFRLI